MNKIKYLLAALFLICSISSFGQILKFRTTAFASNSYNYYTQRWTGWSSWENSDMLLTINLNNDVVTIYSPKTQIYSIYDFDGEFYDSDGDYNMVFWFIDQDYDKGKMKLLQRTSGASEVYIEFSDLRWCYRVVRIY